MCLLPGLTNIGRGAPILAVVVIVVIVIALLAGVFVACALAAVSIHFVVLSRAVTPLAILALALLVIIAVALLAALALLVILAVLAVLAVPAAAALGAAAGVRPRYLTLNLEIVSGNCIESK